MTSKNVSTHCQTFPRSQNHPWLRTTAVTSLLFSCYVTSDYFETPWTVACQAPLSMGFPRQGYCSGLPFPTPGDLPHPEIEPKSSALSGRFFKQRPAPHRHAHGDLTSLTPEESLPELPVVPFRKPHSGTAARENPRYAPVITR